MPPPGMTMMRSTAARMNSAIRGAPSKAVGSCPDVSTRSTPISISASSARNGSIVMSKARWKVTTAGRDSRHEPLGQLAVDVPLPVEDAEDNAVGAGRFRRGDVRLHRRDLVLVVAEVAAARPDHDVQLDVGDLAGDENGAEARRDAALEQVGAQLDAVGAGFPRRAHTADRIRRRPRT